MSDELLLLMRLAVLKQRLLGLYNTKEVDEWFETPQSSLQGRRPLELLLDNSGYLHVAGMIDEILDGVYT
jgi:uncharacterized protein (DUF2384 family)